MNQSPSLNAAIAELDKLEAELATKLEGVRAAKRALTGAVPKLASPKPQAVPQKRVKGRKRAPRGSLQEAIKGALGVKPNMTKREIKEAIKANGYNWSLDDMYLSKCLTTMKAAKEIKSEEKGTRFEYRLP